MTQISEARKQKNRANFQFAAEMLDQMQEVFGDGCRIEYAAENGKTIGKLGPNGVRPVIERKTEK